MEMNSSSSLGMSLGVTDMAGRPSVMTDVKLRYALRADRIHKKTTHKAVAQRLGVSIFTLREALYRHRRNAT
jgi:hypothetical protein